MTLVVLSIAMSIALLLKHSAELSHGSEQVTATTVAISGEAGFVAAHNQVQA